MMNEFVYCQRLFYYEFVESVFVESADTLRGEAIHRQVDSGNGALPAAGKEPKTEKTTTADPPAAPLKPPFRYRWGMCPRRSASQLWRRVARASIPATSETMRING